MTDTITPNLFVIGAQKSGTSSFHAILQQHPDIFMSAKKELEFFNHTHVTDSEHFKNSYLPHFQDGVNHTYRGESTATYIWTYDDNSPWCNQSKIYNPKIPDTLKEFLGDNNKFILLLRNPVDRAVSAFFHHVRKGRKNVTRFPLQEAVKWHGIADIGFYGRHLNRWFQTFPKEQFLVLIYEEFYSNVGKQMKRVCNFLEIAPHNFTSQSRNMSFGITKTKEGITLADEAYSHITSKLIKTKAQFDPEEFSKPVISMSDVQWLTQLYADDIAFLSELLGKKLSYWKKPSCIDISSKGK